MSSFYSEMERIIKANGDRGLDVLLYYYGLELENYRPQKLDVYNTVHGPDAGGKADKIKDFVGIIQGDDFFPSTGTSSANFTSAFLYCKESDVIVGDEIRIKSEDDKRRHYKIIRKESVGLTTEVFTKFVLSNIMD